LNIFRSQYFWRSYCGYVLVAIIAIVLLCLMQLRSNAGAERSATQLQLQAHARLLAAAMADPLRTADMATIASRAASLTETTLLRVTVIGQDGTVLVDTREQPERMDNHLHRPEVQMAIARGLGEADRYSETLQQSLMYAAVPVLDGDRLLGVARVARNVEDIRQAQQDRRTSVYVAGFTTLVLVLMLGLFLAWRKSGTLENITVITEAIAQGDFDRRVAESRALGMKRLADAINQMARNSARRVSILTADRNRLATIFTGMVEGVIDVDQKQNIIHINEAAAALLGVDRDRCTGKPAWQEIRNQNITLALDEALRSRSVLKAQISYPRGNDQLVIDIYVASLSDDQGQPIGAVLVLHDVTELRALERVRTDFVANASHELKTPITAIRGLSETVVGDPDVDRDTLMQFMERIHAQSIRLSQLVSDLMTISRLESDQNVSEFTLINFGDLVNRAVQAAQTALESKHHRLVTHFPDTKAEVFGDRQQLSQLVDNLLDNAIKYTPEAGMIQVRVHSGGGEVILEVEDSGIGISPQYQHRVFERFYRVDKARSQSLGGTGLGLSIVKNIAERHGGNVSVISQLGRGSTFSFKMAAAQSSRAS
jgi:two-component system phosphate regulon sensor histidine kinase PhoR